MTTTAIIVSAFITLGCLLAWVVVHFENRNRKEYEETFKKAMANLQEINDRLDKMTSQMNPIKDADDLVDRYRRATQSHCISGSSSVGPEDKAETEQWERDIEESQSK